MAANAPKKAPKKVREERSLEVSWQAPSRKPKKRTSRDRAAEKTSDLSTEDPEESTPTRQRRQATEKKNAKRVAPEIALVFDKFVKRAEALGASPSPSRSARRRRCRPGVPYCGEDRHRRRQEDGRLHGKHTQKPLHGPLTVACLLLLLRSWFPPVGKPIRKDSFSREG